MSLTDPLESERRKTADFKGSASARTATLIYGFCGFLAIAILGFGIGGIFDQMRIMALNSVFSDWESGVPVAVRALAIPFGIIASMLCFGQYSKWNHRYTGRSTYFAFVGPLTLVLLGLALGTWIATTMWTVPDAVGTAVDPVFHENEQWGIGAWILYSAQWWLPGGLALLGIASLIMRFVSGKHRARNSDLAAELLHSGSLVEAEVVKSPPVSVEASRAATAVTLKFEDSAGNSRWVKCPLLLPPREVPVVGEHRPLLFDPVHPGNTKRIFVSPTGGLDADDFLPVQAA